MPRKLPGDLTEHRKDQIRALRARCYSPGQVVAELKKDWNVGDRRVYHYIALVDKELAAYGAALPVYERKLLESQVVEGLKLIAHDAHQDSTDAKATPHERAANRMVAIRALERVGKAIGMFTDRVELSGAGGGPLAVSVTDARQRVQGKLEKLVEERAKAAAAAGGQPAPPA